jgi:hypothetical protein
MAQVVESSLAVPSKSSIRDITVWNEHISKQAHAVVGGSEQQLPDRQCRFSSHLMRDLGTDLSSSRTTAAHLPMRWQQTSILLFSLL